MSLVKDALADVGVSVEEFQTIPAEATIDTPVLAPAAAVDQPSVNIPLTEQPIVPDVTPAPIVQEEVPVTEILEEVPIVPPEAVIAEHEDLQAKADQIVALQTAMEQYHSIVRKAGFNGISNQTAEVLQVHMRIAQQQLGLTSKIGSMESFSAKTPREQHDLATISLEDIKSMAKGALDKFISIIERIIEFIKRTGHNLLDGIMHVERAVDALDAKLAKIKAPGGNGTIKAVHPILKNGNDVDRVVSPDIHGLAHFASTAYPEAIVKFLDGMVKGVLKFDANGKGVEELDAFFAQYSKPLQFLIDQQADKDSLPGGYTMNVSEHGLSIGVSAPEKRDTSSTEEVPVQTTAELRKLVRDIKALVTQLKDIRPESEKISQAGKKLIEAVKRSAAKGGEDTGDIYNEMTMKVGKMVQESSPRAGEIVDYIVKYVKGHCIAIDAQIKVIESGKTTEAGKESAADADMEGLDPEEFRNLIKFVKEGDLLHIQTSLRLCFNYKEHSYESIMNAARVVQKKIPELFEPYAEKAFARGIDKDEANWDEDYYGNQIVYLKTNFSKERFTHCATVAQHLGYIQ